MCDIIGIPHDHTHRDSYALISAGLLFTPDLRLWNSQTGEMLGRWDTPNNYMYSYGGVMGFIDKRLIILLYVVVISFIFGCGSSSSSVTNSSYATPIVSNISGSAVNNSSLTITGSGFGAKLTSEPLIREDFEARPLAAQMTTFGWSSQGGNENYGVMSVDNTDSHNGSHSGYLVLPITGGSTPNGGSFAGVYKKIIPAVSELYASYWIKWDYQNGEPPAWPANAPIAKFARFNTTTEYSGVPALSLQVDLTYASPMTARYYWSNDPGGGDSGSSVGDTHSANMNHGVWHRIEMYIKMSDAGVANGIVQSFFDGGLAAHQN